MGGLFGCYLLTNRNNFVLSLLRIILGVEWFIAGFEKVMDPVFSSNLPKTLSFFISKNSHSWYIAFVNSQVMPNTDIFAWLVSWGELAVGLVLIFGFLTNLGLVLGIFMNLNFYFAAGWTSPSVSSLNLIMAAFQAALILSPSSKFFSLDKLISRKFPNVFKYRQRSIYEK